MSLDFKCGCNCFGHPRRAHSTLHCKYLAKLMAERSKKMTTRGYEKVEK